MLFYLIFGITYGFAAAVMPGPLMTYLISQTLTNGFRRTFPAVFAPLISDGPIAALVLLILIQVPAGAVQFLRFSGGLFILYLAFGAIKAWRNYDSTKIVEDQSTRKSALNAALVNVLNPNPYLGWSLVLGPLLLKGWQETAVNGIALLAGFYLTMIVTLVGIILLFGAARNIGPKVNRIMIGLSAIALACFGFYQLGLGAMSLWWK